MKMIEHSEREAVLRKWLREEWVGLEWGEPIWVEAARGGTVGAPDVFLPLGGANGYCPVELKSWDTMPGMIIMTSRPAQKRLHLLAAQAGCRTAYFALLPTGDKILFPGWVLRSENADAWTSAFYYGRYSNDVTTLRENLKSETFWKGQADVD